MPEVPRDQPRLIIKPRRPGATAVTLLLHGGGEVSRERVRAWNGAALRMRPIGRAIRRRDSGVLTAFLRFRVRGWNGTAADPLADVEFALARIRESCPGLPIILVGHSMGGRAAIRSAGADSVCGVVALAPWLPRGEPIDQLADRELVILHGLRDRRTAPEASRRFANEAEGVARSVQYIGVAGGDHAMLRSARTWHRLIADAVATMADLAAPTRADS